MTKNNFRDLLAAGNTQSQAAAVEPLVLAYLERIAPSTWVATGTLAKALWPDREPGDKAAFAKLCRVLSFLSARSLSHCCRFGPPKMMYGQECQPVEWFRPTHQTPATAQPGGSSTPSPRPPHPDVLPENIIVFLTKVIRATDISDDDALMCPALAKSVNDLADAAEALLDAHGAARKLAQAGEAVQ